MGNQTKHKRSGSSTLRYLNSSAHGMVPVLRAGGETYLWMPATTGGGNVWPHVLTTGTSPGTARKRIALKVGNLTNLCFGGRLTAVSVGLRATLTLQSRHYL